MKPAEGEMKKQDLRRIYAQWSVLFDLAQGDRERVEELWRWTEEVAELSTAPEERHVAGILPLIRAELEKAGLSTHLPRPMLPGEKVTEAQAIFERWGL